MTQPSNPAPAHLCPHIAALLARGKVRDNYAVGDDRILDGRQRPPLGL